jgi:UDP-perosamine 4-acetyltransferase
MKNDVVVVGGGGHAKVCIELLRAMGERVAICVEASDSPIAECMGVPVIHGDHQLRALAEAGYRRAFVAVGANVRRVELADLVLGLGFDLVNAISPHAVLSSTARIGRGVAIMPSVVVNADAEIDDLAIINTGATIDHDCRIGRAAHVAPQCGIAGGVRIGACSFLGVGTVALPGVSVGRFVTVGAGAVITTSLPDSVLAVGVPARIIRSSDGEK